MSIQITNISPVASEIPESKGGKKKEIGSNASQSVGDKVNISDGASFISGLKSSIDASAAADSAKLDGIKQQVASGTYGGSSFIAEGILKNLNMASE